MPLHSDNRGQALVFLVVLLSLLVGFAVLITDFAVLINEKVTLQNALDAGALAGASYLADGLNLIAMTNAAILALGIANFFTPGATLEAIRRLQKFQDQVAQWTPITAVFLAMKTTRQEGAAGCTPLNFLSGRFWPSLMVERVYFLPKIFGKTIPLWMKDSFQSQKGNPFGQRFVRLGGWSDSYKSGALAVFGQGKDKVVTSFSGAEAGAWGERIIGRWILWPPPVNKFKARLTRFSVKWP